MISRRVFIHGACGYVLGALSIGSYSYILEPRWIEVKNVSIEINGLPERFEGMTIAQLSDIHHSNYIPREFVRKCVRYVNKLFPDIIALTGDFVYSSQKYLSSVAVELSELRAKEGVFAVLGNHDDKSSTFDALTMNGINVLVNKSVPVYKKNEYVFIAGVDDLWVGNFDLDKTLKDTDDKPKILLCHNPDAIEKIRNTNVDFVMAGHTHGGQINLPFYGPPFIYSKFGNRYASGLFHEGKTTMYVNKGIGMSVFPVRFFTRPEITLFTLRNNNQVV